MTETLGQLLAAVDNINIAVEVYGAPKRVKEEVNRAVEIVQTFEQATILGITQEELEAAA